MQLTRLLERAALGVGLIGAMVMASCDTTSTEVFDDCALTMTLAPAAADHGELVVATGGPLTEIYDTTVRVAGINAEVVDVTRTDCAACDVCIAEEECSECESCVACQTSCETCVETVTFRVPMAAPVGPAPVAIVNRYGSSGALDFEVIGDGFDSDSDLLLDTDTDPMPVDTGDTGLFLGDTGDTGGGTGLILDTGDSDLFLDTDVFDTDDTDLN